MAIFINFEKNYFFAIRSDFQMIFTVIYFRNGPTRIKLLLVQFGHSTRMKSLSQSR